MVNSPDRSPKAVWENQQAYVWLSDYSNSVSCGGGKPGQGYVAVLQAVPLSEEEMDEPQIFQESQSGTYLHETAGTLRAGKDNFQGVIHPIAFNWQSGGDCRLNPSTEGTDALTVSQLPAVFVPTVDEGLSTMNDQENAALPSSGSQDGSSNTVGGEKESFRWVVRKLTPLECERLMGWPDGYTAVGLTDEGEEITIAKTTRYKICGNGIVAPVTEWIGTRIMEITSD